MPEPFGKLPADEYLLYTTTRNAHRNIEGLDFLVVIFIKTPYEQTQEVAERAGYAEQIILMNG